MNLAATASILAIAIAANPVPPAGERPPEPRSFAEFRPSEHGFAFVNSFEGSPVAIRGIELPAPGPTSYGLCGGMSAGAADFFLARRPVPTRTQAPRRPDGLFAFLTRRNMDSLGDGLAQGVRFGRWMSYPDDTAAGTMALSLGELTAIVARLERGVGTPVGLVLVGRTAGARRRGAVWDNHQVLAFAAVPAPTRTGGLDLRVYDPNHPGNDGVVLRCEPAVVAYESSPLGLGVPVLGASVRLMVSAKRTAPVRGIFAMPYSPARPPEDLR